MIDKNFGKNGPASVVSSHNDKICNHPISKIDNVADTTSAGVAFNGVYLGARLSIPLLQMHYN